LDNLVLDLGKARSKFQEKTNRINKIMFIRIRRIRWIMIKKEVKGGKVTLIRLNILMIKVVMNIVKFKKNLKIEISMMKRKLSDFKCS